MALDLIYDIGKCPPNRLMSELTRRGASHGEAYRAMAELIRDRQVKRTFFGELYIPGSPGGGSGYGIFTKLVVIVGLLFVVAVMVGIVYMAWQRGLIF
jgi:hypothetical protein